MVDGPPGPQVTPTRRAPWRALGLFVLACLVASTQASAAGTSELEARISDQKQELERLKDELRQGRKRVKELENQAQDQAEEIRLVEQNLAMQQRLLEQIDSTEALYRSLLQSSAREVNAAVQSWKERRALLSGRVVALYKHGRPQPGQAWIGKKDPGAWLRTLQGLRAVVRADEALLQSVRRREETARLAVNAHKARVQGLAEIAQLRKAEFDSLENTRQAQTNRLASLEGLRKAEQVRLDQLEASQAMLEKILTGLEQKRRQEEERRIAEEKARVAEEARLAREDARKRKEEEARRKREAEQHRKDLEKAKRENKPPPPPPPPPPPVVVEKPRERPKVVDSRPEGPPPARKGLCWPVRGPILTKFGLQKNPVLGTVTRNLGVEIQGKAGQSVVAAASGTVAAVTHLPGRGATVILQHAGGYFSIYGQLERIQVAAGDKVDACSAIASLEDGSPPRVYFEYRHNLKAEDPTEWLTR